MSAFTPYDGWEDDLLGLASHAVDDCTGCAGFAGRLLKGFEPPKCGKRLGPNDGHEMTFFVAQGDERVSVTCNLPAHHHAFDPYKSTTGDATDECFWGCDHEGLDGCGKPATDPIHSPGHVADVPEEAWR